MGASQRLAAAVVELQLHDALDMCASTLVVVVAQPFVVVAAAVVVVGLRRGWR